MDINYINMGDGSSGRGLRSRPDARDWDMNPLQLPADAFAFLGVDERGRYQFRLAEVWLAEEFPAYE